MSDYAPVTLIVLNIPRGKVRDTFAAIAEREELESIEAGDPIYMDDQRLDFVDEIGSALMDLGVTFDLYQDAKYEYDGEGLMNVPGLGTFSYSGGGSGEPMLRTAEVVDAIAKTETREALVERLTRLVGSEVQVEFRKRAAALEGKGLVWKDESCRWCAEQIEADRWDGRPDLTIWFHVEGNATSCAQNQRNCGRAPIDAAGDHVAEPVPAEAVR